MIRRSLAPIALAAGLAAATCGCTILELADTPCPTSGTKLTYENFGAAFFANNCNRCHSAPDGEREGAPDSYVFDTLDEIRANKVKIFEDSAGTNDSMPPGPDDPPIEQRDHLEEWLACDAPP